MTSFSDFWNLYPRKVAKKSAESVWNKLSKEDKESAIIALPNHIKYWNMKGSDIEFIPHPRTWLNQARWEDEIQLPQSKEQRPAIQWWQSDTETIKKGREIGLNPRPGEEMFQFRDRIRDCINKKVA